MTVPMREEIKEMVLMQNELNIATCGNAWVLGSTEEGRLIDWNRCIYMECAELIDSLNWKHWKSITSDDDWENAQIEVIDIWHFVMSREIERRGTLDDIAKYFYGAFAVYKIEDGFTIDRMHVLKRAEELAKVAINIEGDISKAFTYLCKAIGVNFEVLYDGYRAKHWLNWFRQENGYKDGKYRKIIFGIEDNKLLFSCVNELGFEKGIENFKEAYQKDSK